MEISRTQAKEALPNGRFGPRHYRRVHHPLFQDVYRWAGRYRSVRISKGGNPFCFPENIEKEMNKLFEKLKAPELRSPVSKTHFVEHAAKFLGELNAIHPFREGNGRAQQSFLFLLGRRAGLDIHLTRLEPTAFLDAMIKSFHGTYDPLQSELTRLIDD